MRRLALLLACAACNEPEQSSPSPEPEQPAPASPVEQPELAPMAPGHAAPDPYSPPPGSNPDSGSDHGRGYILDEHGRPLRIPTVRMASATIVGSMPREILRRIVRAHLDELRDCYLAALERDADLHARIDFSFKIDRIGRVLEPAVAESTTTDKTLGPCIVRAMRRWKFPSDSHGIDEVHHSFIFEPG